MLLVPLNKLRMENLELFYSGSRHRLSGGIQFLGFGDSEALNL